METTVQRRFRVEPGAEAVVLQFAREIAGHVLIGGPIDSESQTSTVLIEDVWEDLKMADEKDRDCQYDVNYRGK